MTKEQADVVTKDQEKLDASLPPQEILRRLDQRIADFNSQAAASVESVNQTTVAIAKIRKELEDHIKALEELIADPPRRRRRI